MARKREGEEGRRRAILGGGRRKEGLAPVWDSTNVCGAVIFVQRFVENTRFLKLIIMNLRGRKSATDGNDIVLEKKIQQN